MKVHEMMCLFADTEYIYMVAKNVRATEPRNALRESEYRLSYVRYEIAQAVH